MAPQITSVSIVYSTVCWGADQRKHQSSASLAFVRGIHRWPVNSPRNGPVTRKMFPFIIGDALPHLVTYLGPSKMAYNLQTTLLMYIIERKISYFWYRYEMKFFPRIQLKIRYRWLQIRKGSVMWHFFVLFGVYSQGRRLLYHMYFKRFLINISPLIQYYSKKSYLKKI